MPTCYVQFYCCHCNYVIHANKIIFIVIVIVIENLKCSFLNENMDFD